jgi:ectoine hydroxylase-related dioxygenase (phytanoyl-CoA dioxygenase family)
VVDERRWRSWNVWCARDDVDAGSGPLWFVPGSHRLTVLRGSGIPHSCRDVVDLADARFVEIPLRAGEAVLYDHATIHRSTPNRSPRTRVAAMLGLVPDGAEPVHYHRLDDGSIEVRRADADFYLEHAFGGAPLPAAEVLARFSWDGSRVRPDDVAGLSR